MADNQLQMEIDWCLARLENKLSSMDPHSRPAQDAANVHRILKSSKAPVIKKRQAMRNMFGDYRAKIKAMEKKKLAAMKKSKLVAVMEPSNQSRFLRHSTGAQAAFQASMKSVSSTTNTLNQLSVGTAETTKSSSDVSSSEGEFKFNFDGSEHHPDMDTVTPTSTGSDVIHNNYFVIKPSTEVFRFNFTLDHDE